ncbi:alkylglycerol monooxygenase-like [Penaeus indicus]|uniref:alkylglycerol monooxygenase-like n=1 Tax=Penaeus indicus TaxID=29960 RepID=UPI00300D1529
MTSLTQRVGSLLYLVSPNATTYQHEEEIPNYVDEAVPLFMAFILLEAAVRFALGREVRLNESIASTGVGILHEATGSRFLTVGFILLGYESLYQWRVLDWPWDSLVTWWASLLLVDLCYYWVHRANHEINLLWAVHQIHHSSEDFTLSTALRLSVFQRLAHFGFYQPLALLGVPKTSVVVHMGFNYLFQFWVHTDVIRKLGPIEWVFCTPSSHRVHHGANKWCLDKNYGSLLIVWDRIFGTFQEEKEGEEIVYGLVEQPQSMNSVWHEVGHDRSEVEERSLKFFYFGEVLTKARSMSSWGDSLRAVFYGPGWVPGAPRLGDPDGFPDVKAPRVKYDPQMPAWNLGYCIVHLFLAFILQQLLLVRFQVLPWYTTTAHLFFIFLTVGCVGGMQDGSWWAPYFESLRCLLYVLHAHHAHVTPYPVVDFVLVACFAFCFFIWLSRAFKDFVGGTTNLKWE